MNESQSNYQLLLHSLPRKFVGIDRYRVRKIQKVYSIKSGYRQKGKCLENGNADNESGILMTASY